LTEQSYLPNHHGTVELLAYISAGQLVTVTSGVRGSTIPLASTDDQAVDPVGRLPASSSPTSLAPAGRIYYVFAAGAGRPWLSAGRFRPDRPSTMLVYQREGNCG
jgi:hypothetical protein